MNLDELIRQADPAQGLDVPPPESLLVTRKRRSGHFGSTLGLGVALSVTLLVALGGVVLLQGGTHAANRSHSPEGQPGLGTAGNVRHRPQKHGSISCVKVPRRFPKNRLVMSGATVHVPAGAVLWVALGEGYKYSLSPYPSSFPWLRPISSDQEVLKPLRLCPTRGGYPLRVRITGFRAVADGRAVLLAKLVTPWRGRTPALERYRATVIVAH